MNAYREDMGRVRIVAGLMLVAIVVALVAPRQPDGFRSSRAPLTVTDQAMAAYGQ
ncbi:MAG TPA: hypothetical protein VMT54_11975 [Candidatus Cybelea sp.]|nr:hypothetical protein [Candidatus Cybelea sp.]